MAALEDEQGAANIYFDAPGSQAIASSPSSLARRAEIPSALLASNSRPEELRQ
jgi:hypothetical protein